MHSPFSTSLPLGLAESIFNIPTKTIVFLKGKYLEGYMVLNIEDGEWKIRTKRELEELNKGEYIVKWIKGQRISWLGSPGENGGG